MSKSSLEWVGISDIFTRIRDGYEFVYDQHHERIHKFDDGLFYAMMPKESIINESK